MQRKTYTTEQLTTHALSRKIFPRKRIYRRQTEVHAPILLGYDQLALRNTTLCGYNHITSSRGIGLLYDKQCAPGH